MVMNVQFDFALAPSGAPPAGFMLQRAQAFRGRAWKRSGVPVTAGVGMAEEQRFQSGGIPPEIAFTEVFDDFSGGYGYAYRRPRMQQSDPDTNVYHWAENYDARYQGQLVHAQAFQEQTLQGANWITDIPLVNPTPAQGFAGIHVTTLYPINDAGVADTGVFTPQSAPFPAGLDASGATNAAMTGGNGLDGPPAIFGSGFYIGGFNSAGLEVGLNGGGHASPGPAFYINPVGSMGPGATLGPLYARGYVTAGDRLWAKIGAAGKATYVAACAAGANALSASNYGVLYPVGNGQRSVKDMESLEGQVFLGLADGIYAGDTSGTFLNVSGELSKATNSDNFRDMCIHDGQVIGQHVGGVYAYDPTATSRPRMRQIGPVARSNRSPVNGHFTAVESFGGWLYGGLWTGSVSYVMAGRDVDGGPYQWHVMQRMAKPGRIGRLHVDGVTYGSGAAGTSVPNRLWVGMEGSFGFSPQGASYAPLYFGAVPRQNGNPLAPQTVFSANYNGSAVMYLPSTDRGAPAVQKVYESAEVWADAMASGFRYMNLYYSIDRGTRTLAGMAGSSPVTVLPLGSTNGYFPAGKSIEWSWDSFTTTPGSCHVLRALVTHGKMRPRIIDTISAIARIADNMTDRQGNQMRPAAVQIDQLRSYADPARLGGVPIQLIDLAGATQWVCVLPPIQESEVYEVGAQNPEIAATVQMVVMSLSAQ